MPDKKKILITRTDKLGDVILTLPLISETKRLFPDSEISFLVRTYVKELIENYPSIEKVILLEDFKSFFSFLKFLKKEKFDLVINVFPRFRLALLFFLARIKTRIGTGYRWYSFLFNKKLYQHRKDAIKHESEYNIDLLKTLNVEVKYDKKYYFNYSIEEKNILEEKLKKLNLNLSEKFIIIHPGSKGSARDWSAKNFIIYINRLLEKVNNIKIVLTGIKEEENILKNIYNSISNNYKEKIILLCGVLNLKELMILIDNSNLFVSNSTGPVHIAGALNKNIISFYPRMIPMNPERWRPLSENAVILTPEGNSENINEISPEKVISETIKFL